MRAFAERTGWCQAGGRYHRGGVKRRYATIDEAWKDAFRLFASRGAVLTPYFCTAIRRKLSRQTVMPHPNPWSFRPWFSLRRFEERRRRETCGGFHLTTKSPGILPARAGGVEADQR